MAGEDGWTVALNLAGVEVVGAEVDEQQRQVRLTVVPQWPHRRFQQWLAYVAATDLWHDQLPPLSPPRP